MSERKVFDGTEIPVAKLKTTLTIEVTDKGVSGLLCAHFDGCAMCVVNEIRADQLIIDPADFGKVRCIERTPASPLTEKDIQAIESCRELLQDTGWPTFENKLSAIIAKLRGNG